MIRDGVSRSSVCHSQIATDLIWSIEFVAGLADGCVTVAFVLSVNRITRSTIDEVQNNTSGTFCCRHHRLYYMNLES